MGAKEGDGVRNVGRGLRHQKACGGRNANRERKAVGLEMKKRERGEHDAHRPFSRPSRLGFSRLKEFPCPNTESGFGGNLSRI